MTNEKNRKIATGWIIVASCMLIQAIPFGVASNIQPQFVSYVVAEYGFTLAEFSLIFTLGTIVSAVASPFIGSLFNKVNVKTMYIIGSILSGGGFLAFSLCNRLWEFYIVAGIVQVGTAAISSIGIPLIINRWFDDLSRGKAMGLAFAGSGLGNIFLQQFVVKSLASNGPSRTYFIFGLLSLVVGLAVSILFIRMPHNNDEVVRGKSKGEDTHEHTDSVLSGYTLAEVTKVKFFWVLCIGLIFLGLYVSALAVQFPAYLTDLGLPPGFVGTVGSVFALFCLFGSLLGGVVFDKLGTTKSLALAFVLVFIACTSLLFAYAIPQLAFLFAMTKGLSTYAYMIGPSLIVASLFGKKDFGTILGVVQIFFAGGFAAGSALFGVLVDSFGYTVAWTSVLVFIVIAYALIISAAMSMYKINNAKFDNNHK